MKGCIQLDRSYQFSMQNTGVFPKIFAIEEGELLDEKPRKIEVGREIIAKSGSEIHIDVQNTYDIGSRQHTISFVLKTLKENIPHSLFCKNRTWFISLSEHPKLISDIGEEVKLRVNYNY